MRVNYKIMFQGVLLGFLPLFAAASAAGEPQVVDAKVRRGADGAYDFTATLRHGDEGWKHYADKWEVRTLGGETLAVRTLLHPHVDEQPFTRGLRGVRIPASAGKVVIRAHDSRHGYGPKTVTLELP